MYPKCIFTFFILLMTSCNVYKSDFDCPPCKGVPCASVTEIEGMIIETKEGPDIFPFDCPLPQMTWAQEVANCPKPNLKRVWIPDTEDELGYYVEGHYIYFPNGDR